MHTLKKFAAARSAAKLLTSVELATMFLYRALTSPQRLHEQVQCC